MSKRTIILYALLWGVYIAFSFITFPQWKDNVLLPAIPLLALGSWLLGRTNGLSLILLGLTLQNIYISELFPDTYRYYESRLTGVLISLCVVFVAGTLRASITAIKTVNTRLDQVVEESSEELSTLTCQLVERTEALRISRGQELHDGIGQQLTGIQLFCSSLADQFDTSDTNTSLAHSLTDHARQTHHLIRKISRSLFPIQIEEAGLRTALEELVSCMEGTSEIEYTIDFQGDIDGTPPDIALQFYRICQESILYILNHTRVTQIKILMEADSSILRLALEHDGEPVGTEIKHSPESRLIESRLLQIKGLSTTRPPAQGLRERLLFSAPTTQPGDSPE
jgi:glucose-6-phosphate-specific signal transduction histidine kinase